MILDHIKTGNVHVLYSINDKVCEYNRIISFVKNVDDQKILCKDLVCNKNITLKLSDIVCVRERLATDEEIAEDKQRYNNRINFIKNLSGNELSSFYNKWIPSFYANKNYKQHLLEYADETFHIRKGDMYTAWYYDKYLNVDINVTDPSEVSQCINKLRDIWIREIKKAKQTSLAFLEDQLDKTDDSAIINSVHEIKKLIDTYDVDGTEISLDFDMYDPGDKNLEDYLNPSSCEVYEPNTIESMISFWPNLLLPAPPFVADPEGRLIGWTYDN